MLNLDMVGNEQDFLQADYQAERFISATPIHRPMKVTRHNVSFGRLRTDGAVFGNAGYPMMNLWTTGTVKTVYYHQPLDNADGLTPEIMEDAAKLIYLGILGIANDPDLKN